MKHLKEKRKEIKKTKRKDANFIFIIFLYLFTFNLHSLYSQPLNIVDLVAISGIVELNEGEIKLIWTYPSSENLPAGSKYYIHYSTFLSVNWSTATAQVVISTGPVGGNTQQVFVISGLDNFIKFYSLSKDTTFYFVIWISSGSDEILSDVSNVATGWITLRPPSAPYFYWEMCLPGVYEGSVNLVWSGGGDDGDEGLLSGAWRIQFSTIQTFSNWEPNNAVKISTTSIPAWLVKSVLLTGLTPSVTYYFRIWAEDDLGSFSNISDGATTWAQVDISPPRQITSIRVTCGFKHINLTWTLPYEDSYPDGFIYNSSSYTGYYEIRWRNDQRILNETLWSSATSFAVIGPVIITPLSSTTTVVTGLVNFTTYYFAIKIADERKNWSVVSTSSPFCRPVNSPPRAIYPQRHFVYDPIRNSTATVISSTTIVIDWTAAGWYPGYSVSDNTYDETYGDFISSYTIVLATYTVGGAIGISTRVVYGVVFTSTTIHNLNEDTTYYWILISYDSEGVSSTTVVFRFVINSKNSPPVFPSTPLICPTTVWHTNNYTIEFDWKDAVETDPYDSVVGYKIILSTDSNFSVVIATLPLNGIILSSSYTLRTDVQPPDYVELRPYENQ
ncbi:MAG: hypothetical protein NZ839_02185, partial [Endomicrobia bacterium]|nr:hypothetical protein [Endomicrobiia bacterium]